MAADPDDPLGAIDAFAARVVAHVAHKGKVEPGKHRAFGYKPPGHTMADVRLGWRDVRMRVGLPRAGSSPAKQQEAGLNDDVTLRPMQGEGEKLRDD